MFWLTWIIVPTFWRADLDSIIAGNCSWNLEQDQSWICAPFFDSSACNSLIKVNTFLDSIFSMKFTKCWSWPHLLLHTRVEQFSIKNMTHSSIYHHIPYKVSNTTMSQPKQLANFRLSKHWPIFSTKKSYCIIYQIKHILRLTNKYSTPLVKINFSTTQQLLTLNLNDLNSVHI